MPKRPPKLWFKHCVKGVGEKGDVIDPGAVCGSLWYEKMSEEDRKAALREERARKRKTKKKSHGKKKK